MRASIEVTTRQTAATLVWTGPESFADAPGGQVVLVSRLVPDFDLGVRLA